MKSKITLIVLVAIIIFLAALSFFFWYQSYDANNKVNDLNTKLEVLSVEDNNAKEDKKEDAPIEVALDSDIAVRIDEIISIWYPKDCFHMIRGTSIDKNDILDTEKLAIAYRYAKKEGGDIPKSEMDQIIKEIFGSDDYVPQEFFVGIGGYKYNENEEKFVPTIGWGGGGPASHPARGIYKIDEYSDRYEVYEKYLYIENTGTGVREKNNITSVELWQVRDCNLFDSKVLASYVVRGETDYNTIQNEIQGIVAKNFVKSKNGVNGYEDEMKVLTKFYDQASEYKHTFMKNEDGSFYWAKSEIIK